MLLTEKSPLNEKLTFRGQVFYIDMSFNNILTVFEIIEDETLSNVQKLLDVLYMLTGEEKFDFNYITSAEKLEYAISLRDEIFNQKLQVNDTKKEHLVDILGNKFIPPKTEGKEEAERSYDFIHDAKYIYSSFLKDYQMDLYQQHNKLHWEVFLGLFESLSDDTKMKKIIDIRTRDLPTGKGTEKQREQLLKLKEAYRLPEREVN